MTANEKIMKWTQKFKLIGDLALISNDLWDKLKKESYSNGLPEDEKDIARLLCDTISVSQSIKCHRVAIEDRINNDGFRSPNVRLIYGSDGTVERKENGIKFSYDVTKCMFSKGNISEKMRMSKLDCSQEIIVDLFAGIGYFTLPLLVHAEAKYVHACEWNPSSIQSLKKNLILNGVSSRCSIYEGDNFLNHPHGLAQRVVLGILPSSFKWLQPAIDCLNPLTGGILHCHELVTTKDTIGGRGGALRNKGQEFLNAINKLREDLEVDVLSINKIKKYAPHIEHIVYDIKVTFPTPE